jgi:hypothetical protein
VNIISLESARLMAEAANARADAILDALGAAQTAIHPMRGASGFSDAARAMSVCVAKHFDALQTQARGAVREADRLANISNGLDRLASAEAA